MPQLSIADEMKLEALPDDIRALIETKIEQAREEEQADAAENARLDEEQHARELAAVEFERDDLQALVNVIPEDDQCCLWLLLEALAENAQMRKQLREVGNALAEARRPAVRKPRSKARR